MQNNISFVIFPNLLVENPVPYNLSTSLSTNDTKSIDFLLVEEPTYFTKFPMHKMKLMLHRASMKYYQDYLAKLYPKADAYIEY